jgi:uncharacterized protein YegP (UPF0339 family)
MATATKNGRPARRAARRAEVVPGSAALQFLVLEDNGGRYHWTIVDSTGESLGQSGNFASYDEAEHAACVVRDNAGSAQLERRAPDDLPIDLAARRDAGSSDDSAAERWLDEGGSFSSEAVTRWPAPR